MKKITKNKLERKFSESARQSSFWFMKLHNNPLSHQTTPADYILTWTSKKYINDFRRNDMSPPDKCWVYLVECKQVTCKEGKGRLAFKRLKQMHSLQSFETVSIFHKSYFCIVYYDDRWTNSDIYLVPAKHMKIVVDNHSMVSLNREDAQHQLQMFRVNLIGGLIDLDTLRT